MVSNIFLDRGRCRMYFIMMEGRFVIRKLIVFRSLEQRTFTFFTMHSLAVFIAVCFRAWRPRPPTTSCSPLGSRVMGRAAAEATTKPPAAEAEKVEADPNPQKHADGRRVPVWGYRRRTLRASWSASSSTSKRRKPGGCSNHSCCVLVRTTSTVRSGSASRTKMTKVNLAASR